LAKAKGLRDLVERCWKESQNARPAGWGEILDELEKIARATGPQEIDSKSNGIGATGEGVTVY